MNVKINDNVIFGKSKPFVLIAGPCVIENDTHPLFMAERIKIICDKLNIPFLFKASFDKANRTAMSHYRGVDIDTANKVFRKIKSELDVPITTDFHESWQAEILKDNVDLLQIPAFLCRQTDMLISAAKTGRPVNVKKAQFISGEDMEKVVEKIRIAGNKNVIITERGNTYGYRDYVVDMRNLVTMRKIAPIVFDSTHSIQKGCSGGSNGSNRQFIEPLARAAVAIGVDSIFMEVHDNPETALSDGTSSVRLSNLEDILKSILEISGDK
jgi:2-dehydro-3-deoxyphosphooctonate aldolase (KDO 8-P synthase)|tara:strand:- start:2197 stop:3003 length:807 start_codon:yes stop_codon:yes gene_type:complete